MNSFDDDQSCAIVSTLTSSPPFILYGKGPDDAVCRLNAGSNRSKRDRRLIRVGAAGNRVPRRVTLMLRSMAFSISGSSFSVARSMR